MKKINKIIKLIIVIFLTGCNESDTINYPTGIEIYTHLISYYPCKSTSLSNEDRLILFNIKKEMDSVCPASDYNVIGSGTSKCIVLAKNFESLCPQFFTIKYPSLKKP